MTEDSEIVFVRSIASVFPTDSFGKQSLRLFFELVEACDPLEVLGIFARFPDKLKALSPKGL